MKARLLFGAYEPDKAPVMTDGLLDMANAYPGANGYRPVGAFEAISDAVPSTFTGGASYVASDSSGVLLAGSVSALYRFSAGAWDELATGVSASAPWQFTQFGDVAIGVNGGPTYAIDMIAGTAAVLTGAPTATAVATVRDFVVYGQADGQGNLVQWSGFNDYASNTPGTDQAGYQPMLTGGNVMGIAGGEYGIIVQRSRVVRMTYAGATQDGVAIPFQFDEISPNVGALAAGSIAQSGRRVYFLSDSGFKYCDGNDVTDIGTERVNKTVFGAYSRVDLQHIRAAIDPRRNVVAWLMPGAPGVIFLYDWALDRWSRIEVLAEAILSGFTANVALEQLDALYPNLDTMPYSLDDPRFAGGDPLFLVIANNTVGTLSGGNLAARFTTPFVQLGDERSRLRAVRPLTDAVSGLTVQITPRSRIGDADGAVVFSSLQRSGLMPVRSNGRYNRIEMDFAAGVDWSFAQGLEPVFASGGGR